MGLPELVAGVIAVLEDSTLASSATVYSGELPQRLTDRSIVAFPEPGDALPGMQSGRNGGVIIAARDFVIVEYHRVIPEKEFGSVVQDVTETTQALREIAFGEFNRGGGRFSGAASQLHGVMRRKYGELGWNEFTFGVRLAIDLSHHSEIGG